MSNLILPTYWHFVPLHESCFKQTQIDPSRRPDVPFKYIDVSSVSNEFFRIVETKTLLGWEAPSRARKQVFEGDIIFATVRPTLKRVAIVPQELNGQVCSTGYCVVRPDKTRLEPGFAYCWLLTEYIAKRVENLQKGATYPAISDKDLLNECIPLPPLREQRAIAAVIRAVQDARDIRRSELDAERERKAALMADLFTRGLHGELCQETEIGPLPMSWAVVRLGDICTVVSGGTPERNRPEYWGGTIPWVKTGEIDYGFIMDTEERITDYIFHFLAHSYEGIRNLGHGAQQKNLNAALIKSISIALPPHDEQKDIAAVLTACDQKIAALEKEIALHDELFRAMLEELMTGRLSALPLVKEEFA